MDPAELNITTDYERLWETERKKIKKKRFKERHMPVYNIISVIYLLLFTYIVNINTVYALRYIIQYNCLKKVYLNILLYFICQLASNFLFLLCYCMSFV